MKMLVLTSLLFIAGVQLVNSQAVNSTWWPCPSVTPEPNVDLDKILGVWYAQQITETGIREGWNSTICTGLNLYTRTSEGITFSEFLNYKHYKLENSGNKTFSIADPVSNPALWVHPSVQDISIIVVDQAADDSTLTLSGCKRKVQHQFTYVFSRSLVLNTTQREAVSNRLEAAGIDINRANLVDTSECREL